MRYSEKHPIRAMLYIAWASFIGAGVLVIVNYLWGYSIPLAASLLFMSIGSLGLAAMLLTEGDD